MLKQDIGNKNIWPRYQEMSSKTKMRVGKKKHMS